MKRKGIILSMFLALTAYMGLSQDMLTEQIVDISKKAAKGSPSNVIVDDTKQQIDIVYTTKSNNKLIKFDVLQFDYDLNLINEFSDEQEVEKARAKYDWFGKRYRGDEYTVTNLRLGGMMLNKLELVETKYFYSWFSGKYKSKENVLNEVKAKDLFGKAMWNPRQAHWNDQETGNLIYINGIMDKKTFSIDDFVVSRITPDLEKTEVAKFTIPYAQRLMGQNAIGNTDGHGFIIYADAAGKGVKKNVMSPNPANWTYLRFAPDGSLIDQVTFDTKVLNWSIAGASQGKDGAVYIYGAGESKGAGEEHQKTTAVIGTGKQDAFQVVKIKDGKTEWVSAPTLDQINAAGVKPPDQKKMVDYNGKSVEIRGISVTSSGESFVTAQDFGGGAIKGAGGYGDLYMFHFAADGTFKRYYGIQSSQDKGGVAGLADAATNPRQYPTNGNVFEGSNGKLHWMMEVVEDIYKYSETEGNVETTYWIPLRNIRVGQIDISSGQIDKFEVLGDGKFYLYNDQEPLEINGGKQIIYMGTGGDRGRQLWLAKFDPSKS
ncbi:MAG: hypothetical protein RJQ09_02915 [Cyclobacteriaceae bacterium]